MEDLLDINKLQLLFVIVIPGFISLKIWSLLVPSKKLSFKDYVMEAIFYSFINFSLLFWLIIIAERSEGILQIILFICILFVAPISWSILWKIILSSNILQGKIIHPTPNAWDYFFSLGKSCFMLIHLKSGILIGGLYYKDSLLHPTLKKRIYISKKFGKLMKMVSFWKKLIELRVCL